MHFLECTSSPSGRGVRALPGEVTDNIIDHLHADTETLRATALVCRSWLSSSQLHLFSVTRLQLLTPGKGLTDFLAWSSSAQYATAHVEVLIIEGNFTEYNSGDTKRPEICVQDVEIAMGRLPSLDSLIIRGLSLTSRVPVDGLYRPSTPRILSYVLLCMVTTVDGAFYPVAHFLLLFTKVEDLSVKDLECMWNPDLATISSLGLGPPIEHALRVEHLTTIGTDGRWNGHRGIIHLFRHTQPKWQLKGLMAATPSGQLEEIFETFLPRCQETLTCLQILVPVYDLRDTTSPDDTQSERFSLYRCPILETLELWVIMPTFLGEAARESASILCDGVLATTSETLLGVAPSTLRTVKITFTDFEEYDSSTEPLLTGLSNWTKLDDALYRLEHAEVVCVMTARGDLRVTDKLPFHKFENVQGRDTGEEVDGRIPLLKRMLPMTQASGRLKFQVVGIEGMAS